MRFLITAAPCTNDARADGTPAFDEKLFAAYMKYNEDMTRAGVLVVSEGLAPGGARARVGLTGGKRTVIDGPFTESKELLGGFYVIEVASKDEALAWALRHPVGFGFDEVLEIRQLTELGDLPPRVREIIADVAPKWSSSLWRE